MADRDYLDCKDDDYLSCGDDTVVEPVKPTPVDPVSPTPAPKPRKDDDIVYELFYGVIAFFNNLFARIFSKRR